jgi:hypothetical protein
MNIEFWFDPECPFCWLTSRWLNDVAPHRDLQIDWKPMSLLFKNNPPAGSRRSVRWGRTRDLLRVVEAVRAAGDADRIGSLYTEFGRHIHNRDELDFDVEASLEAVGLDAKFASALDDGSFDAVICESMDDGLGLTGTDVGTPIIALTTEQAGRVGLFGPVMASRPEPADALELWDGFVKMIAVPGFYELKRGRADGLEIPPEDTI